MWLMLLTEKSMRFVRVGFQWLTAGRLSVIGLVVLGSAVGLPAYTLAASTSNARSPLGINLIQMAYYNPEQPFLNIFKTTGPTHANPKGWFTHAGGTFDTGEEAYLQLDANGYPKTLSASSADPHSQQFTSVGVLLVRELPHANAGTGLPYRAGKYVVLYDGQGTLEYGYDAKLVSSSPGRDVFNVATPSNAGVDFRITATDPNHTGNYIRNIRVVKAEEESLLVAGNVFEPQFLSLMQNFRVLRAMQWLNIDEDGGLVTSWAKRTLPTDAGWGSPSGVPLESVLQLCNLVGADCWLNVPHQADNDYITQMATLAHANLGTTQKLYIEFSNEVWNGIYAQSKYASDQGQAMWPNAGVGSFAYNRSWYGMRSVQMCDIWKSVWGADWPRVVCVLGAQAGNSGTITQSLDCPLWTGSGNAPCSNHNITAVAIAPYFGNQVSKSIMGAADGGHAQLFQGLGGDVSQVTNWVATDKKVVAGYNLPLIAYEGGQGFQSFDPALSQLYIAANRDARMAATYKAALDAWKQNGGEMYVLFADISGPNLYGQWGALESFMDTVSPLDKAPPKWQAIQNFISATSCWWAGCTGTVGPTTGTPTAPILSVK
jgi:hypothetical protein